MTYIAFDGGYFPNHKSGVFAVVKVEDHKEELITYGIEQNTNSSDIEWVAARWAQIYAERLGIQTIRGDFVQCINGMKKEYPQHDWEWIPSKSNPADKFAKYLPELL